MPLKKYTKGNITAAFGADITRQGSVNIPNLLLSNYTRIGLTDSEMILLIHLIRIQCSENDLMPSVEKLSSCMSADIFKIKTDLAGLIEKNILEIVPYYDEETDSVLNKYSFEPLFVLLSEMWACQKVKELQHTQKMIKKNREKSLGNKKAANLEGETMARVYKAFEREFGRLLSPYEIEMIQKWLEEYGYDGEIVLEALRNAVLMGKHNFKYIDGILLEWKKNHLRSVDEIAAYNDNFKKRQSARNNGRLMVKEDSRKKEDKRKKKELIKLLYMN